MGELFGESVKKCCCGSDSCCPTRCIPVDGGPQTCANPLPLTLTIELSDPSPEGCFDMSGTLTLLAPYDQRRWGGSLSKDCTWCSQNFTMRLDVIVTCNVANGWLLEFDFSSPAGDCGGLPVDAILTATSCDPIYLAGDIDCFECPNPICEVPDPPNPPNPTPHDPWCLSAIVYEVA